MDIGALEEKLPELHASREQQANGDIKAIYNSLNDDVQITCFTEDSRDATLYFQIIRFPKQIFVWIGCNSAKYGHLYAAAPTQPSNTVGVASLLKGSADNTGSSMARRLVLKTGLNVVLACNIPKNSPILEATAERKLIEKLASLGFIRAVPSPS